MEKLCFCGFVFLLFFFIKKVKWLVAINIRIGKHGFHLKTNTEWIQVNCDSFEPEMTTINEGLSCFSMSRTMKKRKIGNCCLFVYCQLMNSIFHLDSLYFSFREALIFCVLFVKCFEYHVAVTPAYLKLGRQK
jgi:hypothetical protein